MAHGDHELAPKEVRQRVRKMNEEGQRKRQARVGKGTPELIATGVGVFGGGRGGLGKAARSAQLITSSRIAH